MVFNNNGKWQLKNQKKRVGSKEGEAAHVVTVHPPTHTPKHTLAAIGGPSAICIFYPPSTWQGR
jgi:hypothetical protein